MKPCKRGHTSGRYTSGQCIECAALRKGKERTLPADKVAATVRAVGKLGKLSREEVKLRREKARTERRKLKAENDAAYKATREAERARLLAKDAEREAGLLKPPPPTPTLTVTVEAPASPAYEYETKYSAEGVVTRRLQIDPRSGEPLKAHRPAPEAPKPAAPVIPQTNLPTHLLPVWAQESRSPTRAELAAAHEMQRSGYIGPASSFVDNGVDLSAGPAGVRVPVFEDHRDSWRDGGSNWTKRL